MNSRRWSQIRKQRLSRRSVLRASARAGVGVAGLALVGCGADDDDDRQPQTLAEQQQQQEAMQQQAVAQPQQQEQSVAQQQVQQQAEQEAQQQQAVAQPQQQEQSDAQEQVQQQQEQPQTATPEPAESPRGGTLRFGVVYSPANYSGPYAGDIAFGPAIWESLTKYSADGLIPQPHLAESWDFNDDETILRMTLRPGLTFHDGKPLTAEEVKKSLERMDDEDVANSQVKSIYNTYVNEVTAIDEVTLQFDLAW